MSAMDRKFYLATPIAALCGALLAHAWAPRWQILLWFAAVCTLAFLARYLHVRIGRGTITQHTARRVILSSLAAELPGHIAWISYVPMCWIAGSHANNVTLTLFMLVSLMAALRIYSPCLHMMLGLIVLYLPFCMLYTPSSTPYDILVATGLQTCFIVFVCALTLHHYKAFRQSAYRLFMIETLAKELTKAKEVSEESNRAKSAFLASMSHELRTPLNAIIGFSDLIRNSIAGPISPPKYGEYINDIHSSGRHLLELINDVLDLSKIESGKHELAPSEFSLPMAIDDVVRLVGPQAAQRAIRIKINAPKHLLVTADERALRQILLNFLSNAIKFSPQGETVDVFASATTDGSMTIGVIDHGIGMDAHGIKKALQPYGQVSLTTHATLQGTGLGLPIAKALVEAHGAVFRIESALGQGTRVWGEFPPGTAATTP